MYNMAQVLSGTTQTSSPVCIVCAKADCGRAFKLGSKTAEKKKLKEKIEKYGEIFVEDGAVCRNCERRLETLDKTVSEFREKCQRNATGVKLVQKSPHYLSPKGKAQHIKTLTAQSENLQLEQDVGWMKQLQTSVNLMFELQTTLTACATQVSTVDSLLLTCHFGSLVTLLGKISAIAQSYKEATPPVIKQQGSFVTSTETSVIGGGGGLMPQSDIDSRQISEVVARVGKKSVKEECLSASDIDSEHACDTTPDNDQVPVSNVNDNSVIESKVSEVKCQENQNIDIRVKACETETKGSAPCNHMLVQDVVNKRQEGYKITYKCITCGKQFESMSLFQHIAINPAEQKVVKSTTEQCIAMGVKFGSLSKLERYLNERKKDEYQCETCGKKFPCRSQFTRHEVVHSDVRPYKCETCGMAFKRKDTLSGHQETAHLGNRVHNCDVCGKTYTSKKTLTDHQFLVHSTDRPYACDVCGKTYGRISQLNRHKAVHSTEKLHVCDKCGKSFKYRGALKLHMASHSAAVHRQKRMHCVLCGKTYASKKSLTDHQLLIHKNVRPYLCDLCGKAFAKKSLLNRHREVHSTEKSNACEICGKSFKYLGTLKLHMAGHGQRSYVCEVCGRRFTRMNHLKEHHFVHTGEKPFKCDACGKTFIRRSHLKQHMQIHVRVPEEGRQFQCQICDEMFNKVGHLKEHVSVHSDARPYKCELCDKSYKRIEDRNKHLAVHTGIKPHQCAYCGKAFLVKRVMLRHQMIHTGERPYVCEVCGRAFRQKFALKEHQNIHTGAKPYCCKVCGKEFTHGSILRQHKKVHMPK